MLRPFAIIGAIHLIAILFLAACVKRDPAAVEAREPAPVSTAVVRSEP